MRWSLIWHVNTYFYASKFICYTADCSESPLSAWRSSSRHIRCIKHSTPPTQTHTYKHTHSLRMRRCCWHVGRELSHIFAPARDRNIHSFKCALGHLSTHADICMYIYTCIKTIQPTYMYYYIVRCPRAEDVMQARLTLTTWRR